METFLIVFPSIRISSERTRWSRKLFRFVNKKFNRRKQLFSPTLPDPTTSFSFTVPSFLCVTWLTKENHVASSGRILIVSVSTYFYTSLPRWRNGVPDFSLRMFFFSSHRLKAWLLCRSPITVLTVCWTTEASCPTNLDEKLFPSGLTSFKGVSSRI